MKTIIQLDIAGNPIGIIQFAQSSDAPDIQDHQVELAESMPSDLETLMLRWRRLQSGEFVDVGVAPSQWHDWVQSSSAWVENLERAKAEAWKTAKKARKDAMAAPLETPYGVFDADEAAQKSITDAILMLQTLTARGEPAQIAFTLADNSTATLSASEMETVGLLLGAQIQAAHAQARTIRVQIANATSLQELMGIHWPSQ